MGLVSGEPIERSIIVTCPSCGDPMSSGVVVARSPGVKFKATKGVTGDLGGVRLTSGIFTQSAPAHYCESCGTVVIAGRT